MFGGIDSLQIKDEVVQGGETSFYKAEMEARVQDVESRQVRTEGVNSNDVPMAFLPSTATLADVISAVNELIKRDASVNKVE